MITILPIPFRRSASRRKSLLPAPPTELALVSAAFDVDALTLTLVFNQPIDIPSFEARRWKWMMGTVVTVIWAWLRRLLIRRPRRSRW